MEIKVPVDKEMRAELEAIAEERGIDVDVVASEAVKIELQKNLALKGPPSTH